MLIRPKLLSFAQTDEAITLKIEVVASKIDKTEQPDLDLEKDILMFSAPPYYLKLRFEQELALAGPHTKVTESENGYTI